MKWSLKSIHGASSPHFNAALFHIDMLRDVRRKKLLSFCYVVAEGNFLVSISLKVSRPTRRYLFKIKGNNGVVEFFSPCSCYCEGARKRCDSILNFSGRRRHSRGQNKKGLICSFIFPSFFRLLHFYSIFN